MLDDQAGMIVLQAAGRGARAAFAHEPGGHRWQRVPPSEKRNRRHTSTITVAVLPVVEDFHLRLRESDLEWSMTRGSGAGGQARNKTSNAVVLVHRPSGIRVRAESTRSATQNREAALTILSARLHEAEISRRHERGNDRRRDQIGSGQRGDKIRTIRTQDGVVVDHASGRRASYRRYRQGYLEDVHPQKKASRFKSGLAMDGKA